MEIDPRFKAARKNASRRRRQSWLVPTLAIGGGSLVLAGIALGLYLSGVLTLGTPEQIVEDEADHDHAADSNAKIGRAHV